MDGGTHGHEVLRYVRPDDASRREGQMTMDPEDFAWPRVATELGGQGDGSIGDRTHTPVDGHDERHALLITTQ